MNATDAIGEVGSDVVRRISGKSPSWADAPRFARHPLAEARAKEIDKYPVLVVDDGDVEIECSSGLGRMWRHERHARKGLAASSQQRRLGLDRAAVICYVLEPVMSLCVYRVPRRGFVSYAITRAVFVSMGHVWRTAAECVERDPSCVAGTPATANMSTL